MEKFKKNMLDLGIVGFKAKPYGDRLYLVWDEVEGEYLKCATGSMRKFASTWEAKRFAEGLIKK